MGSRFSGIFWVDDEGTHPLAVVLCPSGGRSLRDQLMAYKRGGIDTIVSLLELDEAAWLGLAEEGPLAKQIGMDFLSHPIPDHNNPLDERAFRTFVSGLAERLRAGERIGVHCWGSIGRATVTAACTLVHLGWNPYTALGAIQNARGCQVPDTPEQRDWIYAYKARA